MKKITDNEIIEKIEKEAFNQMQFILAQLWIPIIAICPSPFLHWQPYGLPLKDIEIKDYEVLLEKVMKCIRENPDCKVQIIAQDKDTKKAWFKFLVYHPLKIN